MLMTTGQGFDGYHVEKYLGVISKEVVFKNGLGTSISATLSNIAKAFSFRDAELKGSTELIENAKDYVMQQFEELAKRKGANAIIAIDVETSFGETVARAAINGTAVVVRADDNSTSELEDDSFSRKLPILQTNEKEAFLPVELILNGQGNIYEVSLAIRETNAPVPSDIKADLEFVNIFGDKQLVENVCFLNLKKKGITYESNSCKICLRNDIGCCVESCSVIIKKVRNLDQIIQSNNTEMHTAEEVQEALMQVMEKDTVDEYGWIIDEADSHFVKCPSCGKRVSVDYMKYRSSCVGCGYAHEKTN